MSFASIEFLLLLPLVLCTCFSLPQQWRHWLLLLSSYGFYGMWHVAYIPLLLGSSLVDFWCGQKMYRAGSPARKKFWLGVSLVANLGVLFLFKYSNFIGENLRLVGIDYPLHSLLLPIGLSFYTLQTLSYTFDIYLGKIKPESKLEYYLLYVSFFPQLASGPIERSGKLLPQLKNLRLPTVGDFRYGGVLIVWGFFLKFAISNNLNLFINATYFHNTTASAVELWMASFFVLLKIYCDFMAYSEIARGTARLFGIELTKNFNQPLLAKNIRSFWQRWHISLTRWLIDYVLVPLARRFSQEPQRSLATVVTLVLVGLWHGASWNYVLFGLYHGVVMMLWAPVSAVFHRWLPLNRKLRGYLGWFNMLILVSFSGPIFFITDTPVMFNILGRMLVFEPSPEVVQVIYTFWKMDVVFAIPAMFLFGFLGLWERYRIKKEWQLAVIYVTSPRRWACIVTMAVAILFLGNFSHDSFVYFNF